MNFQLFDGFLRMEFTAALAWEEDSRWRAQGKFNNGNSPFKKSLCERYGVLFGLNFQNRDNSLLRNFVLYFFRHRQFHFISLLLGS